MKLALKSSTRLHLEALLGIALGSSWWPIAYYAGFMADAPLWLKIAMPVFCAVALYLWFRQGLSSDQTRFTPKWR